MEYTEDEIKQMYENNFKAADYVDMQENLYKIDSRYMEMPSAFFYDVLRSGRFQGSRMLELGCGPLLRYVASASAFFTNIVMADYLEENCEEIKQWLKGNSKLKQFLDIPAELEGYSRNLEIGKQLLESRIRQNLKQVVRCDIMNDNIFMEELKSEVCPPYDLILSSMCLQAASPNFDCFKLALRRISNILRPGGGLVLVGFLDGERIWNLKQSHLPTLSMTEEQLRMSLKDSGFGNIQMKSQQLNMYFKHGSFYCLATEKI